MVYLDGPNVTTGVLTSEKGRQEVRVGCGWRKMQLDIAGFEDGGRSHEPRNTGSFWKLEKTRK